MKLSLFFVAAASVAAWQQAEYAAPAAAEHQPEDDRTSAQEGQEEERPSAPERPQQEGYGHQQSYGHEPAVYEPEHQCCVTECPFEAPFFSLSSCNCHEGERYEPYYRGEHYGHDEGRRRLFMGFDDYSDPEIEEPLDSIDTRYNVLYRSGGITLWVGFGILFVSGWTFLCRSWEFYKCADCECCERRPLAFLCQPTILIGFICLWSSLAYLAMATENGFYTRCCDGRWIFWARYVDWLVTTPLLLWIILYFANACDDTFVFLFWLDILMILSGLIGATVCDGFLWFFFAFAILCWIPIIYYICSLRGHCVDCCYDYSLFFWNFRNLSSIFAIAWFFYPWVWVAAYGPAHPEDRLSVNGEAIAFFVLDIISKAFFGWFIICMRPICNICDFDDHEACHEKVCYSLEKAGYKIDKKTKKY